MVASPEVEEAEAAAAVVVRDNTGLRLASVFDILTNYV